MPRRYRKRGKSTMPPEVLLVILLLGLLGVLFPTFSHNISFLMPVLIGIAVLILIALALIIWRFEKHRRAKWKAFQMADIDNMTGVQFEEYVGELLTSQGYKIEFTKVSGDYGGDLVVHKGENKYAIQLKRYSNTVNLEAVQQAVGSMAYYHCTKSAVITSNYFRKSAKELAAVNHCILIDRDALAEWILAFQNGEKNAFSLE